MEVTKVLWVDDLGAELKLCQLRVFSISSISNRLREFRIVGHLDNPDYYLVFQNKFSGQYIAVDTVGGGANNG